MKTAALDAVLVAAALLGGLVWICGSPIAAAVFSLPLGFRFVQWAKSGGIAALRKELALAGHIEKFGYLNPKLVCPHCQTRGEVRTKRIDRSVGVSGAKVAAAVLFSPLLLFFTGIGRREGATRATCDRCSSTWTF